MSIVTDLDQLSKPVQHSEERNHEDVVNRLSEALKAEGGYGLSANQLGISGSRTCIVSVKEEIPLINPRIVDREGKTETTEGCLSIPNVRLRTERSVWIEVKADNWMGTLWFGPDTWNEKDEADENEKKSNLDYIESIAVQHEIDHLQGKTIYDREVKQKPFEKSDLQKLGRNDKVFVENEEGDEFEVKWKHAKKHDDWTVLEIQN